MVRAKQDVFLRLHARDVASLDQLVFAHRQHVVVESCLWQLREIDLTNTRLPDVVLELEVL